MRKTFLFLYVFFLMMTVHAGDNPVLATYEGTQLKFVENKGQWASQILYRAEIPDGKVYLMTNGIYYDLLDAEKLGELQAHRHDGDTLIEGEKIAHHGVKVSFLGASKHPITYGTGAYPEKINYLIGNDRSTWGRNITAYNGVVYKNIYPHIDLKVEMTGISFKYEFIVHPEGDPNNIQMRFEGQDELSIVEEHLLVKTSVLTFTEKPPLTFQYIDGQKKLIKNEYVLDEDILSFKNRHYKKGYDLIIDPQLIFSTYSGSTADNWGNTATVDEEGNLYTGGTIFGGSGGIGFNELSGFPATVGAFQTVFQGGDTDIGIIKFDSSGTFAYYITYIGGNGAEIPTSIITDDNGELYILGTTSSTNFPGTDKGFQTTFNGGSFVQPIGYYRFTTGSDIVVSRLSKNGDSILVSTYMGGTANDGLNTLGLVFNYGDQLRGDINIDTNGDVYVASTTQSNDFPVLGGVQNTYGGNQDAVLFKLNPDLDNLIWSTYLGGNSPETGTAMNLDTLNNAFIVGATRSELDFPVTDTLEGYDANTNSEAYVTKISPDGSAILASVKVGTDGAEQAYFVQLDNDQNVYILGQNIFEAYPITSGTYFNKNGGVFIHAMTNQLDSTIFSTTIGDTLNYSYVVPNISPTAFLVNECGNMFISGWGGELNTDYQISPGVFVDGYTWGMPMVKDSYQKTSDSSDFYLMVLEREAKSLIYSTYYGSPTNDEHVDGGTSRFDKKGIVYQSVCAGCIQNDQNFPLAPLGGGTDYPKANLSANCNNGVFKFDLANLKANINKPPGCVPLEVAFANTTVGGIEYHWYFGDGKDSIVFNTDTVVYEYQETGQYKVKMVATDRTTCIGKDSVELFVMVNDEKPGSLFRDTTCIFDPITLNADTSDVNNVNSYQWFPVTFLDDPTKQKPVAIPTSSIQYTVSITDSVGCEQVDTIRLSVHDLQPNIEAKVLGNCTGVPKVFFDNKSNIVEPAEVLWDFGDGQYSSELSPKHQYATYDSVLVRVKVQDKYCAFEKQIQVSPKDGIVPNIFTPNGDGINECFIVPRVENDGDWALTVHNRWGDLIFSSEQYQGQWCGENLSDGTYFYLLISSEGDQCKGWVEILR